MKFNFGKTREEVYTRYNTDTTDITAADEPVLKIDDAKYEDGTSLLFVFVKQILLRINIFSATSCKIFFTQYYFVSLWLSFESCTRC